MSVSNEHYANEIGTVGRCADIFHIKRDATLPPGRARLEMSPVATRSTKVMSRQVTIRHYVLRGYAGQGIDIS
jgi:hypothetical protein